MRSRQLRALVGAGVLAGMMAYALPAQLGVPAAEGQRPTPITPELAAVARDAAAAERLPVLIELARADIPPPAALRRKLRAAEHAANLAQSYSVAADELRRRAPAGLAGALQRGRTLWIGGAVAVELTATQLRQLETLPGIRRVYYDGLEAVELSAPPSPPLRFAPEAWAPVQDPDGGLPSGLRIIGAPELWNAGATGEGTVVAIIDSGVDGTHPLLSRKWRGLSTSPGQAWFDPWGLTARPEDDDGTAGIGHGTIVASIAVGSLAPGDTLVGLTGTQVVTDELQVVTGVAPGAEWMAANAFEGFGGRTYTRRSVLLQSLQWALDPDGDPATVSDVPDVVNNSWGFTPGGCDGTFDRAIDALELAGVPVVFAAGNRGSGFDQVAAPAERADLLLNAFAVGAAEERDGEIVVASNSLGGPSPCAPGAVKPEVVAPGAIPLVRRLGAATVEVSGRSGAFTSWAAPHAAGALAVLAGIDPSASADGLKRALFSTAVDLPPQGLDNRSGAGLIDLPRAAERLDGLGGVRLALASWRWDSASATLALGLRNGGSLGFPGGDAELRRREGGEPLGAAAAPPIPSGGLGVVRFPGLPRGLRGGERLSLRLFSQGARLEFPFALGAVSAVPVGLTDGAVTLSLDGHGRFGRAAGVPGFEFLGRDWLTGGGFLFARDGRVSDGAYVDVLQQPALKANPVGSDTDWREIEADVAASDARLAFSDDRALWPLGVAVSEEARLVSLGDSAAYALLEMAFDFDAGGGTALAGLLLDWDFEGRDSVTWDAPLGASVMTRADSAGPWFALTTASRPPTTHAPVPLGTPESGFYRPGAQAGVLSEPEGFTDSEKARLMRLGAASSSHAGISDWAQLVTSGPLRPGATATFVVAAGRTRRALRAALNAARAAVPAGDADEPARTVRGLELLPPYPNPFDPASVTAISLPYLVERGGDAVTARLEVYTIAGDLIYRERRTLLPDAPLTPFRWDGLLAGGELAASGVYGYVIRVGGHRRFGKFVLLK